MSRATLEAAIAKMDAVIARVRKDIVAEQSATASAPHHYGCMLHPSHGGDCVITRPTNPRYVFCKPSIDGWWPR